jgi:hypothetical protein
VLHRVATIGAGVAALSSAADMLRCNINNPLQISALR